nr:FtsQ-type POTRA domain-containing protein [Parachlamydiales bacterium]
MEKDKEPLRLAWKTIFFSLLAVSIPAWLGFWGWQTWRHNRSQNTQYAIHAIIQTGPQKEALKTVFLEELLNLSCDVPCNLYSFSLEKAQDQLLSCPVIKTASLKKIFPDTLYIDYSVRTPIALVHEYTNTGVDEEGIIFPIAPFFTPKRLPEFHLGLPCYGVGEVWGEKLTSAESQIALELLKILNERPYRELMRILRIDVANAFSPSFGQRQIVVILEDEAVLEKSNQLVTYQFPRILRLTPKNFKQELQNYLNLREELIAQELKKENSSNTVLVKCPSTIIDMRLDGVAYVRH